MRPIPRRSPANMSSSKDSLAASGFADPTRSRRPQRTEADLLRDLDRRGKLTEVQRRAPIVRMVIETGGEPDGAYERLYTLVLPLVIAGHETTGHTMSWAIFEIARNPELERAVLEEAGAFRAARAGRALTTADWDERPLMWALFAESLRRYPPVQAIARTTTSDGVVPPDPETGIGSFRYNAGAMVVFSVVGTHLDPSRWPEPRAFRPDRWMSDIRDGMSVVEKGRAVRATMRTREQAFDWLGFSDGPGRCPGQHFSAHEFILVLDALLSRYRFELVDSGDVPWSTTGITGPEAGRMSARIRPR